MGWGYSPLFHMTSKVALRLIPTAWPEPLSPPFLGHFQVWGMSTVLLCKHYANVSSQSRCHVMLCRQLSAAHSTVPARSTGHQA